MRACVCANSECVCVRGESTADKPIFTRVRSLASSGVGGEGGGREGEGGGGRQEVGGRRQGGGGGKAGRGRERVECRTGYVHIGHNNYGEGEESTKCLCWAKLHREGTHNSQYKLVINKNRIQSKLTDPPHLQAAAEDIVCREPSRHSPCRCRGEL